MNEDQIHCRCTPRCVVFIHTDTLSSYPQMCCPHTPRCAVLIPPDTLSFADLHHFAYTFHFEQVHEGG